jgi:hypothetical protein
VFFTTTQSYDQSCLTHDVSRITNRQSTYTRSGSSVDPITCDDFKISRYKEKETATTSK